MNRRLILPVVAAVVLVPACSGSESASTSSVVAAPSDAATVPPSDAATVPPADAVTVPPADAATVPSADAITVPTGDFDICATVPSLEVINTVLDEPATRTIELERGPESAICEAGSDNGIANVQFSRSSFADRAITEQIATELGSTVVDLNDPELPGAFAYSAVVVMIIDGVEYTVQAITLDTITNPESAEARQRSVVLMKAWLANLGV